MRRAIGLVVAVVVCLGTSASGGDDPGAVKIRKARGKYLVEGVAMCQACHSPRNERGVFQRDQWLGGARVDITRDDRVLWSELAPPIAGLPTLSGGQAVLFMMLGEKPNGLSAKPPMPEYRLKREDAEAVVTYLKALVPPG